MRCYESGQLVEDKTITFVWDGWDLVYERHEDGNQALLLERKYAWGLDISGTRGGAGGAGGLLAIEEIQWNGAPSTSTTVLPLYDGSGHVVGLANTAGTLLAEYWWGPFGELIEASGPMANSNPWRYATKYHDVETGLSYFGHRYYDPLTGQWLSREPLGEGESLNLYAYCHNDPINKVDVLGLDDKNIDEFAIRLGLNLEFGSGSSSRTGPAIDLSAGWEHHFSDNTSSRLDVFTRFSKSGLGHPHNKSKAYTGDWKGYYGAGLGVSFHEGKGGPLDSFLINQYTASAIQNTSEHAIRYGQYL